MPIALTCTCGAKLEIDDAFAGKVIPCPDCERPLMTVPVAVPEQRTSMAAILSLLVSLVGGLTLIGGLIGAGLGIWAVGEIDRSRGKLGGLGLAKAGVLLGVALSILTLTLILFQGSLGLDGTLRALRWAGRLDFAGPGEIEKSLPRGHVSMKRPAGFGLVEMKDPDALRRDDLVMYNPREDAYLVFLIYPDGSPVIGDGDGQFMTKFQAALRMLKESDTYRMLLTGQLPLPRKAGGPPPEELPDLFPDPELNPERFDPKTDQTVNRDFDLFDITVGKQEWTFLVYYFQDGPGEAPFQVAAAITPKERFEALEDRLREALRSASWRKTKRERWN